MIDVQQQGNIIDVWRKNICARIIRIAGRIYTLIGNHKTWINDCVCKRVIQSIRSKGFLTK